MRALGTGEMSRASGLSLKALRLYDANGLLAPAEVDPRTGYRRYSAEQVARARAIATLRRLDVPLATVAAIVDGTPSEVRARLLAWWAAERAGFAVREQSVERVANDTVTDAPVTLPSLVGRVRFEDRPEQTVATVTRVVTQPELLPSFLADVLAIRSRVEGDGAIAERGHWVLFHSPVGFDLPGRVETCVPYSGLTRPSGPIVLRIEPAARFAVVDVRARELDYPALLGFYDAVREAAGAPRGSSVAGAPREWYSGTWPEDPEAIAAQIAMPVALLDPAPGADSTMDA